MLNLLVILYYSHITFSWIIYSVCTLNLWLVFYCKNILSILNSTHRHPNIFLLRLYDQRFIPFLGLSFSFRSFCWICRVAVVVFNENLWIFLSRYVYYMRMNHYICKLFYCALCYFELFIFRDKLVLSQWFKSRYCFYCNVSIVMF